MRKYSRNILISLSFSHFVMCGKTNGLALGEAVTLAILSGAPLTSTIILSTNESLVFFFFYRTDYI